MDSRESHQSEAEITGYTVIQIFLQLGKFWLNQKLKCFLSRDRDPASQAGATLPEKAKGTISNDLRPRITESGPFGA